MSYTHIQLYILLCHAHPVLCFTNQGQNIRSAILFFLFQLCLVDAAHSSPTNFVVVLVDDLDVVVTSPFYKDIMPNTVSLKSEGLYFENAFATTPTCCPSRSSLLSGRYTHNTGVEANRGPWGARKRFLDDEDRTIAAHLESIGYFTHISGKYLNGFEAKQLKKENRLPLYPSGWTDGDVFASPKAKFNYSGYRYTLVSWSNITGENATQDFSRRAQVKIYGEDPEDYANDVIFKKSLDFMKRATNEGSPFFSYIAPTCPHYPMPPAPRHKKQSKEFIGELPINRPNFLNLDNEPQWIFDSRKSRGFIRKIGGLTCLFTKALCPKGSPFKGFHKVDWRNRMGSMLSCDEGIRDVVKYLKESNQWNNTLLIFLSDNGYNFGAHTLWQKTTPNEESIRVPFLIASGLPLKEKGVVRSDWVLNIDVMPTLLDFANLPIPEEIDGLSLKDTLSVGTPLNRDQFLIEYSGYGYDQTTMEEKIRKSRDILPYRAIRKKIGNSVYKYIKWAPWRGVQDEQLFELTSDPWEMNNLIGQKNFSPILNKLKWELQGLEFCSGSSCH